MVIDPVFPGPLQQEMFIEMNDLLNQVNEEEEDILVNLDDLPPIENELDNLINDPQNVDVVLPHLNIPVDAMHHEIQENELMNDEEIQQQIAEEAAQEDQAGLQNIQVGRVIIQDAPLPQFPGLQSRFMDTPGPWANFFSRPSDASFPRFVVPVDWANFLAPCCYLLSTLTKPKA